MAKWRPVASGLPKPGRHVVTWDGKLQVVCYWCSCASSWFIVEGSKPRPESERLEWIDVTHWKYLDTPPGPGEAPATKQSPASERGSHLPDKG